MGASRMHGPRALRPRMGAASTHTQLGVALRPAVVGQWGLAGNEQATAGRLTFRPSITMGGSCAKSPQNTS